MLCLCLDQSLGLTLTNSNMESLRKFDVPPSIDNCESFVGTAGLSNIGTSALANSTFRNRRDQFC